MALRVVALADHTVVLTSRCFRYAAGPDLHRRPGAGSVRPSASRRSRFYGCLIPTCGAWIAAALWSTFRQIGRSQPVCASACLAGEDAQAGRPGRSSATMRWAACSLPRTSGDGHPARKRLPRRPPCSGVLEEPPYLEQQHQLILWAFLVPLLETLTWCLLVQLRRSPGWQDVLARQRGAEALARISRQPGYVWACGMW